MAVSSMVLTNASLFGTSCSPFQSRYASAAGTRTPGKGGGRRLSLIVCGEQVASEGGGHSEPPKLEAFSRSRLTRSMKEKNLVRKAEDAINDRCMVLEGEDAWNCWEAVTDFEKLKEEAESECSIAEEGEKDEGCQKLERLENMVRQSGGVNSLIDNVRMVFKIREAKKNEQVEPPTEQDWLQAVSEASDEELEELKKEIPEFFEEGAFPKSEQELQEEEKGMMPESAFSLVLKRLGHHG